MHRLRGHAPPSGGFAPVGGGFAPVGGGFAMGEPRSYVEFNLFLPEPQSFPASTAELAALGWSPAPEAAYACQEAAGSTLADFSGNAHTLTINGAATKCLIGQRAVGLFDGSSFTSQHAWETVGGAIVNTDYGAPASVAVADIDFSGPVSALGVFRCQETPTSSVSAILGKRDAVGFQTGWIVYLNAAGQLLVRFQQGATVVTATTPPGVNYADGGWHWFYLRHDPVADLVYLDTDQQTGITASTAAITSCSNTTPFRLGAPTAFVSQACQIRWFAFWRNADTAVSAIQNWWRHGKAPAWLTYTRASAFHSPVADDATGDVLATWGSGQVAYQRDAKVTTNALKLGLASYAAVTNLIPNSDVNDTTNWVATGTATRYDGDSPRGFREAMRHAKTGASDETLAAAANGAAVTATYHYNASIWCEWDGNNTAPELRVYRADGTTLIGSVSATVGGSVRRRLSLNFTAPATEAVRLAYSGAAAGASTGGARFFGPQITLTNATIANGRPSSDGRPRPYVATKGATASTAVTAGWATSPGLRTTRGTIRAWATFDQVYDSVTTQRYPTGARPAIADPAPSVACGFTSSALCQVFDPSGVFVGQGIGQAPADLSAAEVSARFWWDRSERNGWSARAAGVGLNPQIDMTADIAYDEAIETISLTGSGNGCVNGVVSKIRVWTDTELAA